MYETDSSKKKDLVSDFGQGAILFPKQNSHKAKLFDSTLDDERFILKSGAILDSSKVRGPSNIPKLVTPYTGR